MAPPPIPTFSSSTDPAPAGTAGRAAAPKRQSAAAVERSLPCRAVMLLPVSSQAPAQLIRLVHGDIDGGGLLKQRVVPRVLEHGRKTGIVVDRAGGGYGPGVGCAGDGVAAQRAIAERAVKIETGIDIDVLDAARVLLVEFHRRHSGSRQRTEDIPGSTIHVVLACEARTVHTNRGGQQCRKAQGGGHLHAFTPGRSLKRDPHHGESRGADRSVERAFNGWRCSG